METIDKIYQSYYTKCTAILDYMVDRLQPKAKQLILEPCAGNGVFIEALLQHGSNFTIDVYELNPEAYKTLEERFSQYDNINIHLKDAILGTELPLYTQKYDRIIGNPPYGAWQDYERRDQLKEIYPELYIKETYTLFLYKGLELLKQNGRLVFIIPSTFLNLHMHTALRKTILQNAQLEEIAIFPSKFFPGVNYGYAKMCIITLSKNRDARSRMNSRVQVFTNLSTVNDLHKIRQGKWNSDNFRFYELYQEDIYRTPDHALLVHPNPKIPKLINSSDKTIGDIADCVTGFYSGNDKKYLRRANEDVRGGKRYKIVNKNRICKDPTKHRNILDGIDASKCFVPIVKGGSSRYYKPDKWYMDWSKQSVAKFKESKKARFQNPHYYFQYGIAVPMVSSVPISGSLIERKLFDQSIVGVFPKNSSLLMFLLAYFNSEVCGELISTINPTANNSANYIKKIPVFLPDDPVLDHIKYLTKSVVNQIKSSGEYKESYQQELNEIFWCQFKKQFRTIRM